MNDLVNDKNTKRKLFFFCCIIFLCVFVFFVKIHPILIFNGDDWCNLSNFRTPLPKFHAWNPEKVLPESLMPLIGYIAAYFISPIIGDYLLSITTTSAFIVTLFVVAVFFYLYKFLTESLKLNFIDAGLIGCIFITLHFAFLQSKPCDNQYLLYADSLTCYVHYIIPALLNSCIVLWLMGRNVSTTYLNHMSLLDKGVCYTAIYFAIFSNIFHSVILASFCGIKILCDIVNQSCFDWKKSWETIKSNVFYVSVIIVWLFSLILSATGSRAKSLSHHSLLIHDPIINFIHLLGTVNSLIVIFAVITMIILACVIHYSKTPDDVYNIYKRNMIIILSSIACIGIFLLLVCSKAGASYMNRADTVYGFFWYILLAITISFAYIVKKVDVMKILLPLITIVLLLSTVNSSKTLQESHLLSNEYSNNACVAIDRSLIDQIQTAVKQGQKRMTLKVPKGDDIDNWPHPKYMGKNISRTLLTDGLIDKNIEIDVQPDPSLNEKYHKI